MSTESKMDKYILAPIFHIPVQWVPRVKSAPWQAKTGALNYKLLLSVVGNICILV